MIGSCAACLPGATVPWRPESPGRGCNRAGSGDSNCRESSEARASAQQAACGSDDGSVQLVEHLVKSMLFQMTRKTRNTVPRVMMIGHQELTAAGIAAVLPRA